MERCTVGFFGGDFEDRMLWKYIYIVAYSFYSLGRV